MKNVKVDFGNTNGKIKCINAVNNGPAGSRVRMTGNFNAYKELEIPYARLHDSSFYAGNYGGEFSVDVHRIFPDFNADENDPNSYIFAPTDSYLEDIESVGTKIFYRLGASIEHEYKKGTYPPADYEKWARICEHIIRHYTQGWANGYKFNIEYWEIWNEFDCRNPDGSNPCWQGTDEQFFEFYCTVSKYLKSKFPHLKIGGPASADGNNAKIIGAFLEEVKKNGATLDFFSYHSYFCTMERLTSFIQEVNAILEAHGFGDTPTFLNEWNYVRAWTGDVYNYSMKSLKNYKGASFVSATMCTMQKEKLDMLMYYDARPSSWNGIFASNGEVYKPFYTFKAASEIVKLKNAANVEYCDDIYAIASTDNDSSAIMLTYYNDNEESADKTVRIEVDGARHGDFVKAEFYLIDEDHSLELVREEYFTSDRFAIITKMKNYDTYLIKFKN